MIQNRRRESKKRQRAFQADLEKLVQEHWLKGTTYVEMGIVLTGELTTTLFAANEDIVMNSKPDEPKTDS